MKNKQLPLILAFAGILLFSSYSMMYPGGAPAAKTGSPGDGSNCSSCHGGSATTTAGQITSNIPASGYVPGQTYQITATNPLTGSGKFGFEVSPQNVAGTQLGTLVAGTGSKLLSGSKYVTHSNANSSTSTWTFGWIAPAAGTGPVTFYGAFARNYTGATTLSSLTVQEAASTPAAAGTITGPAGVCLNNTESYSVGTIAGATGYVWTAPAGATIMSGQGTTSVSISFGAAAVSGNVSVYGTNGAGNGPASNLSVTVNTAPVAAGNIAGSNNPCQTTSQTYSVTNVSGTTYTWTIPSGSVISSGQGSSSINVTIGAGNGNITVVPSNLCGTAAASSLAVTVSPVPAAPGSITGVNSPCQATTQAYSVTDVPGITYTWNVPSGSVITSGQGTNSVNVTVGASSGNVTVVPSNTCGNGTASNLLLTVNPVPSQPGSIAGSASPCQAAAQTYTVANTAGVTYTWSVPSGFVITSGQGTNSINVTVGSTNGTISVQPSNSCGTGASSSLTVNVSTIPAQAGSIAGNGAPCQASSQTYSVTNVAGVNYAWNVPSGTSITSGQGTNSINATIGVNGGNITVEPSNSCGNGAQSSFAVSVAALPTVPATPDGPAQVDVATTPASNYSTSAGNASYAWHLVPPTAGTIAGTSETAVVTWSLSFTGNAEISAKGQNGCGESAWSTVKTTQVMNTTGINEEASGIRVVSGESAGNITLLLNTNAPQADVSLLDISGRILLHTQVPGQGTQLINQQLRPGIYIIVIRAGDSFLKKRILILG